MHRKILVLQLRGRKTNPLVGVKEFFEDERSPGPCTEKLYDFGAPRYAPQIFSAPRMLRR